MNGKQIISLVLGTPLLGAAAQIPLSNLPLQERLKALSERDEPKIDAVIAMCYMQARLPDRHVYLCPVCGHQTVYLTVEFIQKNGGDGRVSDSWEDSVRQVTWMRSLMKDLAVLARQGGYELRLDESGLCAECGKEKEADIVLVAVNAEGKEKRTEGFNSHDVTYLTAFFNGKDYYEYRGSHTLKEKAGRIAELLGLKLEEEAKGEKNNESIN